MAQRESDEILDNAKKLEGGGTEAALEIELTRAICSEINAVRLSIAAVADKVHGVREMLGMMTPEK